MLDPAALFVFLGTGLVILLTPGPAVLYIVARTLDQGRRAGLVSVLGIAAGTLFHIAAAAFGLSAILVRSAMAFQTVRYAGAAYLLWLGIQKFRHARDEASQIATPREPLSRIFRNGVVVNLLNPKTALFFFAFLPQFVRPGHGPIAQQMLTLGLLFMTMAMSTDALYALAAGRAAGWLRRNETFTRHSNYVTGTVYLGLGVAAAAGGGPHTASS
jgi:threonine/homoserine/homoserine lactone efflux protein